MELIRLKEVLKERGITGNDLARAVGVHPMTISRIVSGSSFPSGDLLYKISKELDIDIRELFYKTKETEELNGFIEYRGEVYKIKSTEDLNRLSQQIG
jgi:transcriptional regulator with XRE-family HTH domain